MFSPWWREKEIRRFDGAPARLFDLCRAATADPKPLDRRPNHRTTEASLQAEPRGGCGKALALPAAAFNEVSHSTFYKERTRKRQPLEKFSRLVDRAIKL